MRRFIIPIAVAGLLAVPLRPSVAQTSLSQLQQFGPATVLYLPFNVSVAGDFTMWTSGLNRLDPFIRLFSGASFTGPGLGTDLAFNDDNPYFALPGWNMCNGAYFGPYGNCNSAIIMPLVTGDYTLAMSAYDLTEAGARSGGDGNEFNANGYPDPAGYCNAGGDWSTCNYSMNVFSENGQAALATTVTPEPATFVLLGTGLLGLAWRRRKNRA